MTHLKHTYRPLARGLLAGLLAATLGTAAWAGLSEPERLAVGTWYGEFTAGPGQPIQRFINTRLEDGTFTMMARLYEAGKPPMDLQNKGLWGVSNGIYFTVTTEINGQRTDLKKNEMSNPYLVRALAGDAFEYQHIPSGNRFRVIRADPATVRLPPN